MGRRSGPSAPGSPNRGVQAGSRQRTVASMSTTLRLVSNEPEAPSADADAPALVWVQFPDGPEELAERTAPNVARIVSVARCLPMTRVGDLVSVTGGDGERVVYESTLAGGGYVAHRFEGDHPGDRNWSVLLRQLTNRGWVVWPLTDDAGAERGNRADGDRAASEELAVHVAVPAYVAAYEVAAVLHALTGDWARPPRWPALAALAALSAAADEENDDEENDDEGPEVA